MNQLILITPVYVCLFWAIVLHTDPKKVSAPRSVLGKIMIVGIFIFASQYAFFIKTSDLFQYINPLYQFASLISFPLYYLYIRLLTIDSNVIFKAHFKYFIPSIVLSVIYTLVALSTNFDHFKLWVFDKALFNDEFSFQLLVGLNYVMRFTFIVQAIATLIGSSILIKKYENRANQYYSDMDDSKTDKVKLLNYTIIGLVITSIVFSFLGRHFFNKNTTGIEVLTVIFSVVMFVVGWLGDRQKVINPTFETKEEEVDATENGMNQQNELLIQLVNLFNQQKLHLNNELTLNEVALALKTNRTYISLLINQNFNQNFCMFVNQFRVDEMMIKLQEEPEISNAELAKSCGFGSVDSMKRAVVAKTGETFILWKSKLINGELVCDQIPKAV